MLLDDLKRHPLKRMISKSCSDITDLENHLQTLHTSEESPDVQTCALPVPFLTTTPPTPDDLLNKPDFFLPVDNNTTDLQVDILDNEILRRKHSDESATRPLSESVKPSSKDLVLIEITRTLEPVRCPLFSRIHLSTLNLEKEMKIRSINKLKSQTLSNAHRLEKGHFKYLNRQISVSSPTIYQKEKEECKNSEKLVLDDTRADSSSMFYVNDDDEEKEVADNKAFAEISNSRRCSMKSMKSNVSCRSSWTVRSGRRVSMYSVLDFSATDSAAIIGELVDLNVDEQNADTPIGFEMEGNEATNNENKVSPERQQMPRLLFSVMGSLLFPLFSLIVYLWDFISDVRLAYEYWKQDEIKWFGITTSCIVFPVILMTVVDLSWLWMDRPKFPYNRIFLLRFFFGTLSLGRVVRGIKHMEHIVKSKVLMSEENRRWHGDRAIEEKRDYYMLDFINTFTESVPQFIVQLYLYFMYDLPMTYLRLFNILSSWISIAWVYSAYYRCNREAMVGRNDVSAIGFVIFLLSVLACLAARATSITYFLMIYNNWICAAILFMHSFLALLWIVFRVKPEMEGVVESKFGRCLYYLFFAYVYNVCFLHLSSRPAKYRMLAFYAILYIENFVFAGLALFENTDEVLKNARNLIALPIGFILHVLLLMTFYKFFLSKALHRFR